MSPRAWIPLLCLLLCLVASPARAQQPEPAASEPQELADQVAEQAKLLPVLVEPGLGLGGRTPRRGFCRVQADLESREGARRVTVIARPHDEETPLIVSPVIELEPGVPRRFHGLVPARLVNEAATLIFEVWAEGELVGIAIAETNPAEPQLLVLDRRDAPPVSLAKLETKAGSKGTRELPWVPSLLPRTTDLPESALGYTGAGAVLLGSLDVANWSQAQARALSGWLSRGGHLVISLDPQAGSLRKTPLGVALGEGLAPLPTSEAAPIPGSQVSMNAAFLELGHKEMLGKRPATLARLTQGPGDLVSLRDDAGRPILLSRAVGRGRLTLVAFDLWEPPFRHAPATRALLARVLDSAVRFEPRARFVFPKLAEIRQPTQVGPAFALLIVFAMVAGPGIYFLLRAKKRGILLWLAIPGLTLLFTAIVPFYRLALNDAESTLVGVRLVEGRVGSDRTSETIDVLLFSGSPDPKQIEVEGGDATAFAVVPPKLRRRQRAQGTPGLGSELGSAGSDGKLRFTLPVALWGARYFSCERSGRRRPVTGHVAIAHGTNTDDVSVKLGYPGPMPLKEAMLAVPVRDSVIYHRLPDLSMGDTYEATSIQRKGGGGSGDKREGLAPLILEHLTQGFLPREALTRRKAFLIGFVDSPPPLRAKENIRTRAFATIVMIEVPLRFQGGLPFGQLTPLRSATTIAEISSSTVKRQILERFVLPEEARREPLRTLQLRFERPRPRAEWVLEVKGKEGWQELDPSRSVPDETEKGAVVLEVDSPAGWIDPSGVLTLRQTFLRPTQAADASAATLLDVALAWGKPPEPTQAPPPPPEEPEED